MQRIKDDFFLIIVGITGIVVLAVWIFGAF